MDNLQRKEINEAIQAGEQALYSLQAAQDKLRSAKNWGLVDLFGGGFLTNVVKHSKMGDAVELIEDAKRKLQRFNRELQDVNQVMNLQINVGDFLTLADFFFDGLIADYLVQSKINDARYQVDEAIRQVELMLGKLRIY